MLIAISCPVSAEIADVAYGVAEARLRSLDDRRPTRTKSTRNGVIFLAMLVLMSGRAVSDSDEPDVPEAFESCLSCHAYRPGEPELDGPTLWRVMGRRIASVEGYEYSEALGKVSGTWDRATLDRFLTSPPAFAPGIRMTFGGVRSAADRAVVIDFLAALAAASNEDERHDPED